MKSAGRILREKRHKKAREQRRKDQKKMDKEKAKSKRMRHKASKAKSQQNKVETNNCGAQTNQNYCPSLDSNGSAASYNSQMSHWLQSYGAMMDFHRQQIQRYMAENGEDEASRRQRLFEKFAAEYETSSGEEDEPDVQQIVEDEMQDVDEEYLKFMEVTHRHREELRLKRAAENEALSLG